MLILLFIVLLFSGAAVRETQQRNFKGSDKLEEPNLVFTWIFGKKPRYVSNFVEDLDIDPSLPQGFIQLEGDSQELEICLVQRPKHWDANSAFCSSMLPAAVRDFYTATGISIEGVRRIKVLNSASPREAGCRCYVKLMVSLGFNVVNGKELDIEEIPEFCIAQTMANISNLEGIPGVSGPHLPAFEKLVIPDDRVFLDQQIFLV
jgi:hypothetical protein